MITQNQFQSVTMNFTGNARHEAMEGRDYLVAPMVMLTEGVFAGSNGPLYYPASELSKTPEVWNHKPVVVYHPSANGQGCSACSPEILSTRKVGLIMNAKFDGGKLKAEAWLEETRVQAVDTRVMAAINKKQVMELSTGLYTDNESMEGEFEGKKYSQIARNYRPDHLALLPDQKGACSIMDGAGFLRLNAAELSDNEVKQALQALVPLVGKDGIVSGCYVVDVWDTEFVYENGGKSFKQGYGAGTDGKLRLKGLPVEVVRKTNYVTANEQVITGNVVVKEKNKFFVQSKDGKKNLGGPYKTKEEADKRLKQIEYFKRASVKNGYIRIDNRRIFVGTVV